MMIGRRPYLGKDRREIRDSILSKQAAINLEDVPYGWSRDSADFINKLLIRNPQNRLGYNSGEEVRRHPWLKSVEWARLFRKEMKAPFVPIVSFCQLRTYRQTTTITSDRYRKTQS